jgi:nucleoside-diphosphate-sugar epimerase
MNLAGVRVLVTGGAGFVGSHLVERLVRRGARVRVLDNLSSGHRDNLEAVCDDVEIVEGDVRDAETVRSAVRGCEVVSHQAAQLEITRCLDNPGEDLHANTVATLHVLEAAVRAGVRRLVYASSACVYGQPAYIPSDEAKHPTDPNWPYGVSKLACEKYAAIFSAQSGIPMTGLRYAIVYGPREWYGRALTIFLKRLLGGQSPVVFGDGKQLRDFTYVGDVADLHDRLLEREPPGHEVFNVSTGVASTIADVARLAVKVSGKNVETVHEEISPGERSQLVEDRRMRLPSELNALVLDPTKARERLGWTAATALEEGVRREWEWLLAHPQRWQQMRY